MANPDTLDLLRRGAKAWNEWRRTDFNLRPDLSGVDLRQVNLRDVELYNSDLRRTNLSGVDVSGTNLSGANLSGADLGGANLSKARLHSASLDEANLSGTNLSGAELNYANFGLAYLEGTEFRNAFLRGADFSRLGGFSQVNFSGADLSEVDLSEKGLSKLDFSEANLSGAYLREADLSGANLHRANLFGAYLSWADLRGTNLREANLFGAYLRAADLTGADLSHADLRKANFSWTDIRALNIPRSEPPRYAGRNGANIRAVNLLGADLSGADLSETDLSQAILRDVNFSWANLSRADLSGADLTGCYVYATSVWDVTLAGATQSNLIITDPSRRDEPAITVDNLEVAQFIYLLLNNAKIRNVIDTMTSKAVLILGRFTPERKATLEALREALRQRNYVPILFDFEKPKSRDFTETVSTLAGLARFVIADLTDPRSIPQELTAIIPRLLSVPIRPLLRGDQREWAMFADLQRYPQVIAPLYYKDDEMLLDALESKVIAAAEKRVRKVAGR